MPCTGKERKAFRDSSLEKHRREFGQLSCRMCGKCLPASSLQSHHTLPKNSGGANDAETNSTLIGSRCHIDLHDRYTGKLTHLGKLLLEGFMRNSKIRNYNLRSKCNK